MDKKKKPMYAGILIMCFLFTTILRFRLGMFVAASCLGFEIYYINNWYGSMFRALVIISNVGSVLSYVPDMYL